MLNGCSFLRSPKFTIAHMEQRVPAPGQGNDIRACWSALLGTVAPGIAIIRWPNGAAGGLMSSRGSTGSPEGRPPVATHLAVPRSAPAAAPTGATNCLLPPYNERRPRAVPNLSTTTADHRLASRRSLSQRRDPRPGWMGSCRSECWPRHQPDLLKSGDGRPSKICET